MKSDLLLTDVDDAWSKLAKEAENNGGKVVTCNGNGNADSLKAAVFKQATLLVELKQHVKHELRMQTVASKNSLGWKLVNR